MEKWKRDWAPALVPDGLATRPSSLLNRGAQNAIYWNCTLSLVLIRSYFKQFKLLEELDALLKVSQRKHSIWLNITQGLELV